MEEQERFFKQTINPVRNIIIHLQFSCKRRTTTKIFRLKESEKTLTIPKHCGKYHNFTWFLGVEILRKGTVSRNYAETKIFRLKESEKTLTIPKHCGKYHNFTWFLGVEILRKGTVSRNYAETVLFRKISAPENQVKIRYFSQWNKKI